MRCQKQEKILTWGRERQTKSGTHINLTMYLNSSMVVIQNLFTNGKA